MRVESVVFHAIDGGIFELPNCTVAFRIEVVQIRDFVSYFLRDEVEGADAVSFLAR